MLARSLPDQNLRYIHIHEDKRREILLGGEETNTLFSKALGVLPDNLVKLFIGVEGKHDIGFLLQICKSLRQDGVNIPDLAKMELDGELIFFPLGGSNLALWTCRLQKLNRPEFHLYDRDATPPEPAKYQAEADAINMRERCKAQITLKKEIENYLHKDAIIIAYQSIGIPLHLTVNFGPFDDVPLQIAQQVHLASGSLNAWDQLSPERKSKKISRAKTNLNSLSPAFMTRDLLDQIDPEGDLLSWFENMKLCLEL